MRREFPTRIKVDRFQFANGRCEGLLFDGSRCNVILIPGRWVCDHHNPDGLTGEPAFENARCLCLDCNGRKTSADISTIAKAKRREAKHIGAKRPKGNWGAGRNTKWRQRVGGGVERR